MSRLRFVFLLFVVLAATILYGQGKNAATEAGAAAPAHLMITPDQVKWGAGPPALPAGSSFAVLEGDPSKAGPFTIRGKLPDGYIVAPHWHPGDEKITVLSGTFGLGMGEKFDRAVGTELGAGSYAVMPKGMRHFAWSKGETEIQVSGIGPFELNYVNPSDDPRNKAK
jgi:hypothetical protein